mmetsp:Transcript_38636/g.121767  ORF Transcript_38636/g.121767 Transcript_38636/m.121767 type:complete len:278 (-) Transcript_38636:815-1648(-)
MAPPLFTQSSFLDADFASCFNPLNLIPASLDFCFSLLLLLRQVLHISSKGRSVVSLFCKESLQVLMCPLQLDLSLFQISQNLHHRIFQVSPILLDFPDFFIEPSFSIQERHFILSDIRVPPQNYCKLDINLFPPVFCRGQRNLPFVEVLFNLRLKIIDDLLSHLELIPNSRKLSHKNFIPVHSIQSGVFSCSQRFFCLSHTSLNLLIVCRNLCKLLFTLCLSFFRLSQLSQLLFFAPQSIIHFFHGFASGLFEFSFQLLLMHPIASLLLLSRRKLHL